MKRAVRTTPPPRFSSRTSTVVRELRTSTLRPARVASMTYSRAAPLPASTRTSTKSPLAIYASISTQFERYLNVAQPPAKARTVEELSAAAAACQACDLWQEATQTVFGEGKESARMMLVGEQPGDQEDLQGRPFVGPAGRVLEQALDEAGIDRRRVYVTNAVKHFRFTRRGKRRLHEKPNAAQVRACRPWLEAEIEVVKPGLIILLGATAAQAVM